MSVHYVVTYANHSPLAGIDLYKMGRNLDRSDLTELRQSYEEGLTFYISKRKTMGQENICGRNFLEVRNTLHIDSYSDNLMHFILFRVYIWGKIRYVNFMKFSFAPM